MALSYVAHAAMMVTGYKPPFVDLKNSIATDSNGTAIHENLVPDEDAPYKSPNPDGGLLSLSPIPQFDHG